MAVEIGKLFPGCPAGRAEAIARHAASAAAAGGADRLRDEHLTRKRSSGGLASVRHRDTGYDELLM